MNDPRIGDGWRKCRVCGSEYGYGQQMFKQCCIDDYRRWWEAGTYQTIESYLCGSWGVVNAEPPKPMPTLEMGTQTLNL